MPDRFESFVDPNVGMAPTPTTAPAPATTGLPASQGQVYVTGSDGSVFMVPEEDLGKVVFEDEGARLSTAGELRQLEDQKRYGGGNTTLEAIDRAATKGMFGRSPVDFAFTRGARLFEGNETAHDISQFLPQGTPWQQILSGDEEAVAARLKGLEEQHDVATPIAETAGFLGGLLLPGPNAAKGIGGIGHLTELGISKVLGEGVLAKLGSAAGRGAMENYILGRDSILDEAVLGDPNLNAEKLFTENAGLDLILGAGLGAGFESGGQLLKGGKRLTGKSIDAVAEKLFGETARAEGKTVGEIIARDFGGKGEDWLVKAMGLMSGSDPQVLKDVSFGANGAEKRAMVTFGQEAERMKAIEGFRQSFDDIGVAMPEILDEFKGPFKQGYIEKLVRRDNPAEVYKVAMDHLRVLNESLDEIDKMALRDVRGQFASSMDTLRKWSAMTEEQINRMATTGERDAASKLTQSAKLASEGLSREHWDPASIQGFLEKHLPGKGGPGARAAEEKIARKVGPHGDNDPIVQEMKRRVDVDKRRAAGTVDLRVKAQPTEATRILPDMGRADTMLAAGQAPAAEAVDLARFNPTKDFNARVYMSLDSMKRVAQTVSNMRYEMIPDAINRQNAMRIHEQMVRFSESLRETLENIEMFGKAAEKQREMNGLWSRHIVAEKEVKRGMMREVQDISNKRDPYKRKFIGDPEKIGRFVHDIVSPEKDLVRQNFLEYMTTGKQLAEALGSLDLPPEKIVMFKKAVAAAQRLESTFDETIKKMTVINQYEKIVGSGGFLPALAGMGAGHLLGFPAGLLIGGVSELLANPKKVIRMLAQIERIGGDHLKYVTNGIQNWLKGTPQKVERRVLDRKQVTQVVDRIAKLNTSGNLSEEIADALKLPEEFGKAAPNTQFAVGATAARVVSYIMQVLPKQPNTTATALPYKPKPIGDTIGDMDKHTLNLRVRVALKGSRAIVDDMQENRLMVQSVLALQAMYPQQYEEMKKVMMNEIVEAEARGEWAKVPYQRRQALSVAFQMPIDYSQSPEFAKSLDRIRNNPPSLQIEQMEQQQQQMKATPPGQ